MVLNAVLVAVAVELLAIPLWGRLTDRVGRRPVFLFGAAVHLVMIVPLFLAVRSGSGLWIQLALLVAPADRARGDVRAAGVVLPRAVPDPRALQRHVGGLAVRRAGGQRPVHRRRGRAARRDGRRVLRASRSTSPCSRSCRLAACSSCRRRRPAARRPRYRGLGPGARAAAARSGRSCARRPRLRCGREDHRRTGVRLLARAATSSRSGSRPTTASPASATPPSTAASSPSPATCATTSARC